MALFRNLSSLQTERADDDSKFLQCYFTLNNPLLFSSSDRSESDHHHLHGLGGAGGRLFYSLPSLQRKIGQSPLITCSVNCGGKEE